MSTLDEVYDLESRKENLEIIDDYSKNDQLVIELTYSYGSLKITIPDEFPEESPIFEPSFQPVFDDAYINFCLGDFCAARSETNLEDLINYFENELLPELIAETPADKLRPRRKSPRTNSQDLSEPSETEDSDEQDSGNEDCVDCMPPSELPEYQKRVDRHTGKKSKERKHKWNGFFIQKEGLDEVWKTRRIEFHGETDWYRAGRYNCLFSRTVMTRSENVQKRYGGQMDKLGGVQFRRENSKNDFDFVVRVHADSTRQNEKSKQCQNQFGTYKRNNDACHIYLLQYRADDPIFSNKTGFDQLVSEMDKANVVKMEKQLAQRKHDRKKFFRVHKKSDLIRTDLAHG